MLTEENTRRQIDMNSALLVAQTALLITSASVVCVGGEMGAAAPSVLQPPSVALLPASRASVDVRVMSKGPKPAAPWLEDLASGLTAANLPFSEQTQASI